MYLIVWMELEAHCSLCVFTIEPHQKHNQWRLLGKFGILCCVQLLYEKPTSVNQAGLCQAKLEHNCWSLIFFFFQCPGSVFLALSFTFRITVHFFSTFCRLENGDMANARVLFPHRAHTLAVHMHTHTFPQSTACIGDLCIEACFPCF